MTNLKPGWLKRDVDRASQRVREWKAQTTTNLIERLLAGYSTLDSEVATAQAREAAAEIEQLQRENKRLRHDIFALAGVTPALKETTP